MQEIENKTVDQLLAEYAQSKEGNDIQENPAEEVETPEVNEEEETPTAEVDVFEESELKAINLLIESGKLMPMEDDKGNLIPIASKNDLFELIDKNNEFFQQNTLQEVQKQFYESKSPVWQALLSYAEDARDFSEIAPLFNVIQTKQSISNLDLDNESDQEQVLRMYGQMQKLDPKIIEDDIEDLKMRGKLSDRATQLKPAIDKYQDEQAKQLIAQKEQEEKAQAAFLQNHYNSIVENIIKPETIGGLKLTQDHKNLVASTLVPDPKIGGLPIYAIIDNLLESGNFEILSKIALLATDPKNFDNYYSSKSNDVVATDLKRRLRGASSNNSGSIIPDNNTTKPVINNNNNNNGVGNKFYFNIPK